MLVITGRRKFAKSSYTKIAESLNLKGNEKKYFINLVQFNNSTNPIKKNEFLEQLLALKHLSLDSQSSRENLEFWSEWYHPVIRELIGINKDKVDAKWLSKMIPFSIAPRHIDASLKLLEELELIKLDESQKIYHKTEKQIGPDRKVGKLASARFHQKVCEMASESVTQVDAKERELNTMALSLRQEDLPEVRELIKDFCKKIFEYEQRVENPNQVFQMNVQFFPVTKSVKGSK